MKHHVIKKNNIYIFKTTPGVVHYLRYVSFYLKRGIANGHSFF